MTTEELYQQAVIGKEYPDTASGGQRAAGRVLEQLEGIDWEDTLYYFDVEEVAELVKLVAAKQKKP